ncbi:fimbrial biogenesis chaperone [Candidatus Pantoea floridensis]|uniref:P pilus assembly protein, chaperone PapD n=1 Tax=Candidatus Pantoea floridensis TaxID=1938870 RepID=A0A286BQD3_9GAMM|nr:fimbria/pilus periplasmic chaperone [Pantoea floridensis]PIF22978.1 P pilus assembly chaperone PapD [Enterobacteriaceae bacterium JKS000233]SOD36328.1 P pilus assembly protein, chaperone PapD [Pantoea floridensis]
MLKKIFLASLLISAVTPAFSSIVISGTRVIFPGDQTEVNVRTINRSDTPALAQVWVDDGDTKIDLQNTKVPFIVTPPVFRVEPNKGQSIRMIYNGMALPQDRESLFWFNLLEIPPKASDDNKGQKLEVAFRTRIKIFYRPKALLNGSVTTELDKLGWELVTDNNQGVGVKIKNTTPYYYSFNTINVMSQNKKIRMTSEMIAPKSEMVVYPENKSKLTSISAMDFQYINEFGGIIQKKLKLKGNAFFIDDK